MKKPTSADKKQMKIMDSRLGMSAFVQKQVKKQQNLLNDYLKVNLKKLGHEFKTDKDFFEFLKSRISRVAYQDQKYSLFLDATEDDKGIYIGGYSEIIESNAEGNIITATTNFN